MNTNLLGKFATFYSVFPSNENLNHFHNIYGEIVGVFQVEPKEYDYMVNHPKLTNRTVLLVKLFTFDKNSVVEVNLNTVKVFDTVKEAEEYTNPL